MRMFEASKWMNSPQQKKMLEVFFRDSPITIEWNFHGSQKVIDNRLIFGAWAGPKQCITHVIHEMGHLAEIDDDRILKYGWGLFLPEIYIPGRYSRIASVPTTYRATLRECRVIAMAWQIQNFLGIEETPREAISALKFMPDWCNLPTKKYDGTSPGMFSYQEYEEHRLLFLENKMLEYSRDKFTMSFFMEEWKRKNELLKQAMKS